MKFPISSPKGVEDDPATSLALTGVTKVLGEMGIVDAASGSQGAEEG